MSGEHPRAGAVDAPPVDGAIAAAAGVAVSGAPPPRPPPLHQHNPAAAAGAADRAVQHHHPGPHHPLHHYAPHHMHHQRHHHPHPMHRHSIVPPLGVDYATDARRLLQELFEMYDFDGSGTLGLSEVRELLTLLEGTPPTDPELKHLISKIMAREDGAVGDDLEALDLNGFVRFMEIVTEGDDRPVTARQLFRAFDTDGNGKISAQELHESALSMGMDLSRPEADAMVQRAGKKGNVTFIQFETNVFNARAKSGKQSQNTSQSTVSH